jgi:hypothetical protein
MCTWCIKIGIVLVYILTHGSRPLLVDCKSPRVSTAQLLSTSVLALEYEYELNCQEKKINFRNIIQNKGLSPSCIALSFDGFGTISWHSVLVLLALSQFSDFFLSLFTGEDPG